MRHRLAPLIFALTLLGSLAGATQGGGWPQWRGPDRQAHAIGFATPAQWPPTLTRVWSVEAGAGLSSPVVVGGRAYLLTRDGDDEVLTCYDVADGVVVWRRTWPSRFYANGGAINPRFYPVSQGRGPFATPVVRGARIYTLGVDRVLSSFATRNGSLKWRQGYLPVDLPAALTYVCRPCGCEHDGKTFDAPGTCPSCGMGLNPENIETSARSGGGNYYGAAASPLVEGNLGVVHVGNLTEGVLVGFDRKTGRERWRHQGPAVAYASPVVAEFHGEVQLITLTRTSLVGLELATGIERWSHDLGNDAHTSTPVVLGDTIIASTYRGPTFALAVRRAEGIWSVDKLWENAELTQWMTSPVLDGDRIHGFFFSNKGQFASLDARTGETLWAGEGRQGEFAAVVLAGDQLIAIKNDGALVVLKRAGAGFEPLTSYEVADSPTWTYPALFDDKLLVKDESRLTLWQVR